MTFISDQLEIKAVVDFQFSFCYFLKNKMNRVFNHFHEFFRNVTSKSRPDETLPFAQVDELNENTEINSCDGSEVDLNEGDNLDERRNTICEIKKPTISAWDAGWNVSNAIQVSCLTKLLRIKLFPNENNSFLMQTYKPGKKKEIIMLFQRFSTNYEIK